MSSTLSRHSGIITISVESASSDVDLHCNIPMQDIKLLSAYVQMDTTTSALSTSAVYFDMDFLSGNSLHNVHGSESRLVVSLDHSIVTNKTYNDAWITLSKNIPRNFRVNVRDSAGDLLSDSVFIKARLQFGFDYL